MPNPVIHFEIGCRDTSKCAPFYTTLFGWTAQEYGPAKMFNTGSKEGIQGHLTALGHEPHNYTIFYVQVDDLQGYIDSAAKLGGSPLLKPVEVPGMGSFAWIKDPEGNVVGLWKPVMK